MESDKTYQKMNDWLKERPLIGFFLSFISAMIVALTIFALTSWREKDKDLTLIIDSKLDSSTYEKEKKECYEYINTKVDEVQFNEFVLRMDDNHENTDKRLDNLQQGQQDIIRILMQSQ